MSYPDAWPTGYKLTPAPAGASIYVSVLTIVGVSEWGSLHLEIADPNLIPLFQVRVNTPHGFYSVLTDGEMAWDWILNWFSNQGKLMAIDERRLAPLHEVVLSKSQAQNAIKEYARDRKT